MNNDELFAIPYDRVIVTGGGSGIGRAVTGALTERGIDVIVMGRRREKLEETVTLFADNPGTVLAFPCDVRSVESIERAMNEANASGPVQAVVHAASEVGPVHAANLTPMIFADAMASQLGGTYNIFHFWAKPLIERGLGGSFITYSSSTCSRETPGLSHSVATKGGVEALVRNLAVELGPMQLRLNVIAPGLFPLAGTHHEVDFFDLEKFRDNVPIGRFGKENEIVAPTIFLLSEGAQYITGAVIHVDGGVRLRPWFGFIPEKLFEQG